MRGEVAALRLGKGELDVAAALAGVPALEPYEPIAVTDRQRTEGHRVEGGEERGVEADPEREREHRRQGEPGMAAQ